MSSTSISTRLWYTGYYILWSLGLSKSRYPPLTPEEIEAICSDIFDLRIEYKFAILQDGLYVKNITEKSLLACAGNFFIGPPMMRILLEHLRDYNGDIQYLVTPKVLEKAMDKNPLDKKIAFANALMDFAINQKGQTDEPRPSWVMTREAVMIFMKAHCDLETVKRALSLLEYDFLITGEDISSICKERTKEENLNDIIGLSLDILPADHALDLDWDILKAAMNSVNGSNLTRILDRASDLEWRNPEWQGHSLEYSVFWNQRFAPEIISIVLDRFRGVDKHLSRLWNGSLREGYAYTQKDRDGMAIEVLRRRREEILSQKSLRKTGLQNGGPLVVMEIIKKKQQTEEAKPEYDVDETDLDNIVWNEVCGFQIMTTLLDEVSNLHVSQEIFRTAARYNHEQGMEIAKLLLQRCSNLEVDEDIMIDALCNRGQSEQLLLYLLEAYPDSIKFFTTERLMKSDLQWYSQNLIPGLKTLVNHPLFDPSTVEFCLLEKAAKHGHVSEYKEDEDTALSVLMDVVRLTNASEIEELACAALENEQSFWMFQTVYARIPEKRILVTSKVVEAAAKSTDRRSQTLKKLLDLDPQFEITQTAVNNACYGIAEGRVKYKFSWEKKEGEEDEKPEQPTDAIKFLLKQYPDGPKPTSAALESAASSFINAEEMLSFLFTEFSDLEVTETVLLAAAKNPNDSDRIIFHLLDHAPATPLTESFLVACIHNLSHRKSIFNWVLPRVDSLNISDSLKRQIAPELLAKF